MVTVGPKSVLGFALCLTLHTVIAVRGLLVALLADGWIVDIVFVRRHAVASFISVSSPCKTEINPVSFVEDIAIMDFPGNEYFSSEVVAEMPAIEGSKDRNRGTGVRVNNWNINDARVFSRVRKVQLISVNWPDSLQFNPPFSSERGSLAGVLNAYCGVRR
jgi:hypothetical protein